jgi:hypothetical protein
MDRDDQIDDILRLDKDNIGKLTWWRSKNGRDEWTEFKRYSPIRSHFWNFGFVGRFGAMRGGGTLIIDEKRIGQFFSFEEPESTGWFPY